jgi:hypothetical protein
MMRALLVASVVGLVALAPAKAQDDSDAERVPLGHSVEGTRTRGHEGRLSPSTDGGRPHHKTRRIATFPNGPAPERTACLQTHIDTKGRGNRWNFVAVHEWVPTYDDTLHD